MTYSFACHLPQEKAGSEGQGLFGPFPSVDTQQALEAVVNTYLEWQGENPPGQEGLQVWRD